MAVSWAKTPTINRAYSNTTATLTFQFSSSEVQVGDLLIAHTADGNDPLAAATTVKNVNGVAWTRIGTCYNGRNLWYKVATTDDIGTNHLYTASGTSNGLITMAFRNGKVVDGHSGILPGTTQTQPARGTDAIAVKIYRVTAVAGNFPVKISTDSANLIEYKSFLPGESIQQYSTTTTSWHGSNNGTYYAHLVVESSDIPPVVTITSITDGAKVDPREDISISWTYSDDDGDPQTSFSIKANGSQVAAGTGTDTFATIPADTLTDETDYTIEVTATNARASTTASVNIRSDSWTTSTEVISSTQSGLWLPPTEAEGGNYELQVATADAQGFGPFSASAPVQVIPFNTPPNATIVDVTPVVVNNRPVNVEWIYSDGENDPQTKYQLRVRKKI